MAGTGQTCRRVRSVPEQTGAAAPSWAQVKARVRECQLHRDSPLGDTLLECYSCGGRNAFALGFVPVKSENSVVLLCRRALLRPGVNGLRHPESAPCAPEPQIYQEDYEWPTAAVQL